MMKISSWNQYLSSNNPWSDRLLGLKKFSIKRDLEQVEREYDQEKYGSIVEFEFNNIELYRTKELENYGLTEKDNTFISLSEEIFETNISLAWSIYSSIISSFVKRYNPSRICELGCGYGYNFSYLKNICSEVYGGEYSTNAMKIANRLGLEVQNFNYYNLEDYQIIKAGSSILTIHSIEQIQSAKYFIDGIYQLSKNIDFIFNFEPCFLNNRNSWIGTLRNRYIEINHYNKDLINILKSRNDIEIIEYHPDYIGINPLHPTSVIIWRFK
ncbi:MAG: hypothetical protein PUP90_19970 [Nostoc sp. S4]|nr:hypothetical protein [Nostoc sp. S4]